MEICLALIQEHKENELRDFLVSNPGVVNIITPTGDTLLHHAIRAGHVGVVIVLVARGADPLIKYCRFGYFEKSEEFEIEK